MQVLKVTFLLNFEQGRSGKKYLAIALRGCSSEAPPKCLCYNLGPVIMALLRMKGNFKQQFQVSLSKNQMLDLDLRRFKEAASRDRISDTWARTDFWLMFKDMVVG